jgi:malonate decarboxylase epsilon subunit
MKILFTFPGQGTQHPGMLHELPAGDTTLAQARAVLGDEVDTLDSPQALRHTRAVQLCLLIAGTAWARELIRRDVTPDMVSGLSIGAFPAAVITGALSFADALRLVALRGDLMEQAYPQGYGLTAIQGLTLPQVEALVADSDVYIANLNAETQIVIAGRDDSMAQVAQRALEKGASRARRLAVSVPSHCALLDEPARQLQAAFAGVTLTRPRCAYLSGSTARVLWQPERIAEDLALNMARTVRWQEAMIAAEEREVGLAIEMPPGGILTCLTRQAVTREEAVSLERSGCEVAVHMAKLARAREY